MDSKEAILVIDDDEGTRKTLALILKKKGFEVITAGTGHEGLEKAEGRMIAVVLLDINLPDIEGIRLITPIKQIHPKTAVIMITGNATMENAVRALNEGAAGYITKPLNIDDVIAKIQNVLERQHLIDAKQRAEEALHASEKKYRNLVENINEIIYSLDDCGTIMYISPAVEKISGFPPSEVMGKNFTVFIIEDYLPVVMQAFETVRTGKNISFQFRVVTKSGEQRWLNSSSQPIFVNGSVSGSQGVLTDITELKKAEEQLLHLNEELEQKIQERTAELKVLNMNLEKEIEEHKQAQVQIQASLDEKVILLREIHHRVKNNLQIIISLLNLQSRYIGDEKIRQAIRESQNRVRAMSHVHEKLYQSPDITKIDLDNYIRFLGDNLFQFYGMKGTGILLNTRIQDINVDINTAIPVGLIVNELISNSLKHAFPDGRKGEISIAIQQENAMLTIEYKDTGVGIPEDFDWRNVESLGLRLVILLVEQLDGTIELDRTAGTAFAIVVKEKE
ncbi:MAG: histidine kinase dimerization/phosphoacceptor domain -containing protein [Methanoregula sp.]|nr:histidine kinase dimerization/phosphoacceptor domain -containing protein [Methanoregula sp.]